jgi:hypothetical protein
MNQYVFDGVVDMRVVCDSASGNGLRAERLCQETSFANAVQTIKAFAATDSRLFRLKHGSLLLLVGALDGQEPVLDGVRGNPVVSMRQMATKLNAIQTAV